MKSHTPTFTIKSATTVNTPSKTVDTNTITVCCHNSKRDGHEHLDNCTRVSPT